MAFSPARVDGCISMRLGVPTRIPEAQESSSRSYLTEQNS